MGNRPRGLRETLVRALAKVGLVWAVAVLGALFMAMSAQGLDADGGYALSAPSAGQASAFAVQTGGAPTTAGLALALVILGGGVTVLAIGSARGQRAPVERSYAAPDPTADLPLALAV
jgi:hypothetical protein